MIDVLLSNLNVLGAGTRVVVAVWQAEPALVERGNLLGGVLEVLLLAEAEENANPHALQLACKIGQAGFADAVDLAHQALDRFQVLLIDEVGVHAGRVVVADLLLVGGAARRGHRVLRQDGAKFLRVDVLEDGKLVDFRLVGGNGVVRRKVAAGELVEVGAGIGFGVHGGRVERRIQFVMRDGHG